MVGINNEQKEDLSYKRKLITSFSMQYSPEVQQSRQNIVDSLVQHIIYTTKSNTGLQIKEIQNGISNSLGINLTIIELTDSLERLRLRNIIEITNDNPREMVTKVSKNSRYLISDQSEQSQIKNEKESEEKFLSICNRLFENSNHNWKKYVKPFMEFLSIIFSRLGEDNIKIILGEMSPNQVIASSYFNNALKSVKKLLKHLDIEYFENTCTIFFSEDDPEYAELKWNLAQNYYILKVIGLDRDSVLFSRDIFKNGSFYLDTNIVISALSSEDRYHESFIKLCNICQNLGITTIVDKLTLAELGRVVKSQSDLLAKVIDQIPDDTAVKISSDFYEIYYKRRKADKTYELDRVFDIYRDAENELKKTFNIKIEDHEYWISSIRPTLKTLNYANKLMNRYESMRPRRKSEASANHDALMMLLVEKLRDEDYPNVWFVTRDYTLPSCVPEDSGYRSLAITIDALLQWILPVNNDMITEEDIAITFSEIIKTRVLPQERIFNPEDFRIFKELEMECAALPAKDVEDCVIYLRKNLPLLNPLNPLDRETFARHIKLYFSDPSLKFKQDTQTYKDHLGELDEKLQNLEDNYVKKETKTRLVVVFLLWVILESIFILLTHFFGEGINLWQKIINSWPLIISPIIISIFFGYFYLGKKRLSSLNWSLKKLFRL